MTDKTFWRTVRKNGTTGLVPADSRTAEIASEYRTGEVRGGQLRMPRNPRFHRLAHAIGGLAADNLEEFEGMGAHQVLKRLQIEAGVGCDEVAVRIGGHMVIHRIPKSLSFASMSQDEFKKVTAAICKRLTDYWPDTTVEEIGQMADEYAQGSA